MIETLQNFRGIILTVLTNFTLENCTYFQNKTSKNHETYPVRLKVLNYR